MKKIRQTFKSLGEIQERNLPLSGHELRFQRKLEHQNKPSILKITWLSLAASLLLLLGLTRTAIKPSSLPSQELTQFYEQQIEKQLQQIEVSYQDHFSLPIQDIKLQLALLDAEYKKLENTFNEQHQHPLLLKAMIENMQQRLDLLLETEKILDQKKNIHYENSIL